MTDNVDDSYLNSGEFNSSQSDIELDERQLTCSVCSNHYSNRDKGVSDSICGPCNADGYKDLFEHEPTEETKEDLDDIAEECNEENVEMGDSKGEPGHKSNDYLEYFLSKEISFSITHSNGSHCYARKKFASDTGNVVRLFINPEVMAVVPLMVDYLAVAAHFNSNLRHLNLSMCWVRHQSKKDKKFVVLSYLRTKCSKPRYDILVWSEENGVELWTGVTKINSFNFDYDTEVDTDHMKKVLAAWIKEKLRVVGPDKRNKDELGNWISTFDPMSDGQTAASGIIEVSKRKRRPRMAQSRVSEEAKPTMARKKKRKTPTTTKKVRHCIA